MSIDTGLKVRINYLDSFWQNFGLNNSFNFHLKENLHKTTLKRNQQVI